MSQISKRKVKDSMELVGTNTHHEKKIAGREGIALEIYEGITAALHNLLENEGLSEDHSTIVELRGEQKIAERALAVFDDSQELLRAA